MDREIKFRGLAPYTGWEYGHLWEPSNFSSSRSGAYIIPESLDEKEAFNEMQMVDPETVGQYTGLKDKDGVEIYEGDIVEFDDIIFRVTWSKADACFYLENDNKENDLLDGSDVYMKIIGSIHNNPELLQ